MDIGWDSSTRPTVRRNRAGFTLIELIAVIVILAILAGVALPRMFDHSDEAREAAEEASIAGIRTALNMAFLDHRSTNAPASDWVDEVGDIRAIMETGELPHGVVISGDKLEDQRGNIYTLTPETVDQPARLSIDGSGGGAGGSGGPGGGGSS